MSVIPLIVLSSVSHEPNDRPQVYGFFSLIKFRKISFKTFVTWLTTHVEMKRVDCCVQFDFLQVQRPHSLNADEAER